MQLTKEFRGMNDLEMKIKDLEIQVRALEKNNALLKEHIDGLINDNDRFRSIDKAHKNINGKLRLRLARFEEENKKLTDEVKDNKELIQDLYDYP
jgi:predicted RNase H-like nuclease (RuvC/YqgF family)|tara:strand:- start:896 stop:1180 length:285 start_codon:yes stop_codon:yes gene_type:complete